MARSRAGEHHCYVAFGGSCSAHNDLPLAITGLCPAWNEDNVQGCLIHVQDHLKGIHRLCVVPALA